METVTAMPDAGPARVVDDALHAEALRQAARIYLSTGRTAAGIREFAADPEFMRKICGDDPDGDLAAMFATLASEMDDLVAAGFDAAAFRAELAASSAEAKPTAGLTPEAARATAEQLIAESHTAASVRVEADSPRWQRIRDVLLSVADAMDELAAGAER